MRISEVIAQLQAIAKANGDIECHETCWEMGGSDVIDWIGVIEYRHYGQGPRQVRVVLASQDARANVAFGGG